MNTAIHPCRLWEGDRLTRRFSHTWTLTKRTETFLWYKCSSCGAGHRRYRPGMRPS